MKRVIGVLALSLISCSTLADCQALLQDLAKPFEAKLINNTGLSTCKVWPYAPDKTIAVLMLEPKVKEDPDFTDYDVAVYVVDSQSETVLASKYHPKAIMDDAVFTDRVTIDTARYQLSPEVRAFGVRFNHRNSSSVNPFNIERLNLYTLKDHQLALVLNNFTMDELRGEWDGQCTGEIDKTRRILTLGPLSHHGYRDLALQETANHTASVKKGENCVDSKRTSVKTQTTLMFDGERYPLGQDKLLDHRF